MEESLVKNIEVEEVGKVIDVQRNAISIFSTLFRVIKFIVVVPYFFFLMVALKVVELSGRDQKAGKKFYF